MSEPSERDVDREFEALVAGWEPSGVPDPAPSTPPAPPERSPEVVEPTSVAEPVAGGGWRVYSPTEDADVPEDDDEPYVEPEPEPLPHVTEDPGFWVALVGIVAGVGTLFVLGLSGSGPTWLWYSAVVAALVGFAVLLWRRPGRRSDDEGTGARV